MDDTKFIRILYFVSGFFAVAGVIFLCSWPNPSIIKAGAVIPLIVSLRQLFRWRSLSKGVSSLKELKSLELPSAKLPQRGNGIYLGEGFRWDNSDVQKMYNLSREDVEKHLGKNEELGGLSIIHGVGAKKETSLFIPDSEMVGHVALVGATRVGKTRWLETLLAQAIKRREPVIMIDPKGEDRLFNFCYSQAIAEGREKDFVPFALPYPQISATYNPLANYAAVTDIPDRITALLPQGGESQAFTNFCHGVVLAVAEGLDYLGEVITLKKIEQYALLPDYMGRLMLDVIKKYLETQMEDSGAFAGETKPEIWIGHYQDIVSQQKQAGRNKIGNKPCEDLIKYYQHPRDNFVKMSNELGPLLSLFNTDENEKLLSSVPPDIEWQNMLEEGGKIVYFYLNSMAGLKTATSIAQITLQDLISYIGRRYVYTTSRSPVWVVIDEFHNVCYPGFVDLISKAGGAGLRVIIAMQSIADLEANMKSNSKAHAQQILDNTNTKIFMRVTDAYTAKKFTDKVGMTVIKEYSEMTSVSPEVDDSQEVFDTSYRKSKRDKEVPFVRPDWINELPKGQAFVYMQGETYKVRFPLLPSPGRDIFKDKKLK